MTSTTSDDHAITNGAGPVAAWPFEAESPVETRLGIAFSGGGIRSATFALGVYQRLAETHKFERARYLSAVSGGSYLAAGLAISHALCPRELWTAEPPPWGRGSPEEAKLRKNLSYLAPGSSGRLWLIANIMYGLILNLTPLLLAVFVAGRLAGLALREIYPGLGTGSTVDFSAVPWIVGADAALVLSSVAVVGFRRFRDKSRSRPELREARSQRNVMVLVSAAAALTVSGLVLPLVLHAMARSTSHALVDDLGLKGASWHVQRLAVGLFGVLVGLVLGGTAVWLLQRRRLRIVRGLLAAIAGASILAFPFLLSAETGAARAWGWRADGPALIASVLVMLLFAIFAHNRRYSMHLFYRERIQEAFASRRVKVSDASFEVQSVPYDEPIKLSEVSRLNAERAGENGQVFPELVVCAAVAARDTEVPTKTHAASFTFGGTNCGNARLGLQAKTEDVESGDWIGGGNLTLPSIMAISGAAVSPLMGRFTLPAFRFLMAMLNIRLGVWIRNPTRSVDATLPQTGNLLRVWWRYVLRGWREPGAWYVLKEGLGLANTRGRYIYVSDGGHWENLGLIELLRRRCTHLVVVDASGDPGLGDISRALAMARAELGVEIRLDPRVTLQDENKIAQSPIAVGTVHYPDHDQADIYYTRSVLWGDAPSDLHLFASRDGKFPNHPTTNQFLSAELFDAYRALGWAVGDRLSTTLNLPLREFDERPAVPSTPLVS
jgi:hypothetical protein